MPVNFFLLFNWGIICKTCTCFKCKAQWVTAKYSLLTWLTFFVFLLILGAVYECFLLSLTCFCVDPNKKILKHYLEPLTIRRIHIYGISCRWGPPARNHCAELFSALPPAKIIFQIRWVFQVRPQLCSGWPSGESHPLSCLSLPTCETGTCGKAPGGS